MTVLFILNDIHDLKPTQTTTALICQTLQHTTVAITDVLGLGVDGEVIAQAITVHHTEPKALIASLGQQPRQHIPLSSCQMVWVRTNPARDQHRAFAHQNALSLLAIAKQQGVHIVNDPQGLMLAQSKVYLAQLDPSVIPKTLISRDMDALMQFVAQTNAPVVLKPLSGTHGQDVFCVDGPTDKNLRQIIDVLTRKGWAIAQPYVPEAADGDIRVILLHGQCLQVDGQYALVRRRPGGSDFRSNIHAGGKACPTQFNDRIAQVVDIIGPTLVRDGIALAGLDLIGDVVVEVNVFSTGGLVDAEHFYGRPFVQAVVEGLL